MHVHFQHTIHMHLSLTMDYSIQCTKLANSINLEIFTLGLLNGETGKPVKKSSTGNRFSERIPGYQLYNVTST